MLARLLRSHRLNCALRKFGQIVVAPFAVVVALLLICAEPFVRIRICPIGRVKNFGWLCFLPDRYVRNWQLNPPPPRAFFVFLIHSPDNRALLEMWRRRLFIVESRTLCFLAGWAKPVLGRTRFYGRDHDEVTDHYFHYSTRPDGRPWAPSLNLTSGDEKRGREWLESVGIGPDDWWVCFHNRDEAHYVSEHKARNCSIESYMGAAEHVARLGGFAIRMGASVERRIPDSGNSRIIDYASDHRSDFLDIFLQAKCRLFLGNTSGAFLGALIFNKPVAMANVLSLRDVSLSKHDLWIPKHVRDRASGRLLTFAERMKIQQEMRSTYWPLFTRGECGSLVFEENDAADITALCQDMINRIEGVPESVEDSEAQAHFKHIIGRRDYFDIAPSFLRRWKEQLD